MSAPTRAPERQTSREDQTRSAPGEDRQQAKRGPESNAAPPAVVPVGNGHTRCDTRSLVAVPDLSGYLELRIVAESLEDMMAARIACANRMERGGIDPDRFAGARAALDAAEHALELQLLRCYRRVAPEPIRVWQKESGGIGEKLVARLLGNLGHPRIATPYHWEGEGSERTLVPDPAFERTVSQLWSYCGWGDSTRRRRKGMSADDAMALGKTKLKPIVWNIAVAAIKQPGARLPEVCNGAAMVAADPSTASPAVADRATGALSLPTPSDPAPRWPYRVVYDEGRVRYADRLEADGTPWSPGHQHNAAIRLVAKAILKDLWIVAGHLRSEAQRPSAGDDPEHDEDMS